MPCPFSSFQVDLYNTTGVQGRFKEETDPETVVFALYGMVTTAVIWYSVDPGVIPEKIQDTIAAMTGYFCRRILPAGRA